MIRGLYLLRLTTMTKFVERIRDECLELQVGSGFNFWNFGTNIVLSKFNLSKLFIISSLLS